MSKPSAVAMALALFAAPALGSAFAVSALHVGADPNLSHRADPILSQGRRPAC
jgi:hypothetical protein